MKNLFLISDANAVLYAQLFMYAAIAAVVYWVLQIVAYWRLFKKAGVPGWQSIIPIYNEYKFLKITWTGGAFWLLALFALANGFITFFMQNNQISDSMMMILTILEFAIMVVLIVISGISCVKAAHAYGKGGGFAVGLFLLRPVFILILGLGGSTYKKESKKL